MCAADSVESIGAFGSVCALVKFRSFVASSAPIFALHRSTAHYEPVSGFEAQFKSLLGPNISEVVCRH